MKDAKRRRVLAGHLFGMPYFREGNLYLPRQIAPDYISNRILADLLAQSSGTPTDYPDEEIAREQAILIQLMPITSKDVCLDLVKAISNYGLEKEMSYKIFADDPDFSEERLNKIFREGFRATLDGSWDRAFVWIFSEYACYMRCSSIIYLNPDHEAFFIESTPRTGDIGILPRLRKLNGISTKDILEAYKISLESLVTLDYEIEYERIKKAQKEKLQRYLRSNK